MSNPVQQLARRIQGVSPRGQDTKSSRTLSLRTNAFEELQKHCKKYNTTVSSVIDELIEVYLAEAAKTESRD